MTLAASTFARLASHDWAGLALAALVGIAGGACLTGGSAVVGTAACVAAIVAGAAALRHVVDVAEIMRAYPAPGVLVDLGTARLHLLAEGEAGSLPTLVWFGGGHAAGSALHHLHRALRTETRSILIDRASTGWSGIGTFPRTTAGEAEEIVTALAAAGERGPFAWVGHSFGGLLAANIARRHPDLTAALVLLDPTPPDAIVYGPNLPGLRAMRRNALRAGLWRLFGFDGDASARAARTGQPVLAAAVDACLGPALPAARALDRRARRHFADWSIFRELSPAGMAERAWDTVVYDRQLGDLPVYLVAPADQADVAAMARATFADDAERDRVVAFYRDVRERYMATSSRARRIATPSGTGHNFPYEAPDFTAATVLAVLRAVANETDHNHAS